jgi:hypothetical protein
MKSIHSQAVASLLAVFALVLTTAAFSQNLSAGARRNVLFTDLMNGLPISRPSVGIQGDPFLYPQWRLTTIVLYEVENPVSGYYTRYNLHFDELDFKTRMDVRAIDGSRIKSFEFKDSVSNVFLNASEFTLADVPLKGFVEVLVDGPVRLVKRRYVLVKDPDYNPALNSGSRDVKIIKQSELYYLKDGQLFEVKGKKKLLAFFGDKSPEMEKFMKVNALFPNDEKSLIRIFTHYNSLFK